MTTLSSVPSNKAGCGPAAFGRLLGSGGLDSGAGRERLALEFDLEPWYKLPGFESYRSRISIALFISPCANESVSALRSTSLKPMSFNCLNCLPYLLSS